MVKSSVTFLLLGILFLAGLFRFFDLTSYPPSLNWDEVSQGYNAYSILKTGQDEWGEKFPLINFRAYGDYPLPLYMYLSIPGIAVLGLNDLTVRLPSAIFGMLLVLVIYFLCQEIFKKRELSLLVSFLVSLSPWSLLLSRQAIQVTPAVFLFSLGILFFLRGVRDRPKEILMGTFFLGLSAYAYHNARILAPFFVLVLMITFRKFLIKRIKLILGIILISAVLFLPIVPSLIGGSASARATWVGILDQGAINQINQERGSSSLNGFESRLLYNKVTFFALKSLENYIGYFSPQFLGFDGGTQFQFSVPGFGVIYPVDLLFFYIGLIFLIVKFKVETKEERFLLFWLLLSPIPGAITRDPYQVVRANLMMSAVYLVEALGILKTVEVLLKIKFPYPKLTIYSLLVFLISISFSVYFMNFWGSYNKNYSIAWQYGYKQAVEFARENYQNYPLIYFSKAYGEPHEYVLFYSQYDPAKYRSDPNLIRYEKSDWFWVDSFDKYRFLNDWEIKGKLANVKRGLLITSPGNYPQGATFLKSIYFLNGQKAFDIVKL